MYVEATGWAEKNGIGVADPITSEVALDYLTDLYESPVSRAKMVKVAPEGTSFRLLLNIEGLTVSTEQIEPVDYTPRGHKAGPAGLAQAQEECERMIREVDAWWEHLTKKYKDLGAAAKYARLTKDGKA
ncbi:MULTISPECIES: hypothetical protein [Streptomyces]|uniref:hypothetical protein n=1 Tax=Streptomyces TaxID=1883 RepID=UPI000A576B84|nr:MULTISPECIES: hypothetical protein [Streptomyces]